MNTFKKTLIAAAVGMVTSAANATPYFDAGTNSIYYNNLENQYRSDDACRAGGGCLGIGSGPEGWQLVDASIAGNIALGDVFAGVIDVQRVQYASGTWFSSATDQFTGYFAQQIANVINPGTSATQIVFANPASDPFGILQAGEMFRLYTQSGAGTTFFNDQTGGTALSIIQKATDGAFWASLGLTATPDGSYAYSIDNTTLAGTDNTKTEAFLALNFINLGASYNAGLLNLINDKNEGLEGGTTAKLVCNNADVLSSAICSQFVATSEIELNTFSIAFGDGVSPFVFASNDPATISRIPEPASLALMGLGLFGLAGLRRRKS